MKGQIIKLVKDNYYVKYKDMIIHCKARGLFKKDKVTFLVGDWVKFDLSLKVITEVLPRQNELIRPAIANVDQVIILISVKEPNFSSLVLDKMLTTIEFNNIKPIICVTKLDLLKKTKEKKMIRNIMQYYKKIGYHLYTNKQLYRLKRIFKDKITVLTGQSGVGKSTLLNRLSKNLNLETKKVSRKLATGKHTTKHVELFEVGRGLVADTPGFSALTLMDMTKEDIRDQFSEFNKAKDKCKYRNCFHIDEADCAIKKMVAQGTILATRYENYKKLIKEGKND